MNAVRQLESLALEHGYESWSFLHDSRGLTDLDETSRLFTLQSESRRVITSSGPRKASDVVRKQVDEDTKPGEQEVSRFLRLLDVIHTVPWANKAFEVNNGILRQLMCGHLELIVGPEVAKAHGQRLRQLIDLDAKDSHLVWVTNRQQGKTTTICKFLTALAVASTRGGNLAFVYSTSLDRAQEVLRGVKAMLRWLIKKKVLHSIGYTDVRLVRDNEIMFGLETGGVENVMRARPRNIASCRGDAPQAVVVDEIAFLEGRFFNEFLRPLTQVGGRAFSFITTPPARDSWFQNYLKLVKAANDRGDFHFYFISHSLVCAECAANGVAEKCSHNLGYVPPWKSLITLHNMLKLVPASERATYQTEVLGVLEDKTDAYIDSRLMAALLEVPRSPPDLVKLIYLAVDPASHAKSNIGLAAFASDPTTGQLIFLGSASVNLMRAEKIQCDMVLIDFLRRMRAQRPLAEAELLPIIECNNNEISASSILETIRANWPHTRNWMSAKQYGKYITSNVGVWTTHETKRAALLSLQNILITAGRLRISSTFFTTDATSYSVHAAPISPAEAIKTVTDELCRFRDTDKNEISGTAGGSEKDDVGMAFLIALYWINAIQRHEHTRQPADLSLL